MTSPEIHAQDLRRTFGTTKAVDGVDLSVERGEIYGFLGPNGAGKSTVTRVLCTLLAPSGGQASVAGFDVENQPDQVRLRIGVALQEAALDPKQTGVEMLRLQGRFYGLSKSDTERRLADLRGLIDIGPALEDRVSTYSGGMKRRLDLALALVHNPRVLFLDEPTTGLDPVSRAKVWEEVRRLNADLGMTVFLTTQYLEEADELADRVGIIDHGRIVAAGTPEALKRSIGTDLVVAAGRRGPRGRAAGAASPAGSREGGRQRLRGDSGGRGRPSGHQSRGTGPGRGGGRPARSRALVAHAHTGRRVPVGHRRAHCRPGHRHRPGTPCRGVLMSTSPTGIAPASDPHAGDVIAQHAGFGRDLVSVAIRALRQIPREPEAIIPALIIPVFFYVVNVGALSPVAEASGVTDFKAFQLPVAIIFAVTGVSRASALVSDINDGYFDRLLLTPMSRPALLLGLMVADFALVIALSIPVIILGALVGVQFVTGILGILVFLLLAGLWGLAFTGFPYAIALKTGNPAAVNSSFLLFFPFAFLTTAFLPQEALTGWLSTLATYNPVTYVLAALRSLLTEGWETTALVQGVIAILGVAAVSHTLAFMALRGRVSRS